MATLPSTPVSPSPIFDDAPLERYPDSNHEILDGITRPSKKKKITDYEDDEEDCISALPDAIIQHVLSFLSVDEIIRTSVLSKRWRTVWAAVPTLDFRRQSHMYAHQLVSCVNKTLSNYSTVSEVKKFLLRFKYRNSFSSQVEEWVRFATRRHVEELSLDLHGGKTPNFGESYCLSQSIYSCSSLRILNTLYCDFQQPTGRVFWTKLKVLTLYYARLSNEIIVQVLSGSPVLEFLKLQYCDEIKRLHIVSSSNLKKLFLCLPFNRLTVSSSNLKELVIDNVYPGASVIEISAPNINSISLLGYNSTTEYKLTDISSLTEADLSFGVYQTYNRDMLNGVLEKLRHVQKLAIGPRYPYMVESGGKKSLGWKERYFKCLFRHLKIVEITFATLFPHCELELELVEFLLKNGKVLEKMAVLVKNTGISRRMSSVDEKKVQQLVLSYPRASPNVAVLLDIPSY
ncbi:F-box family protein [Melia azedarach]|uniref:F-box family protein n=1 Tax=Melia azedarach TaxID=155640 RepID=A0ACC1WWT2_MELAZ|nr:F-box family protein [Melia azedarach]